MQGIARESDGEPRPDEAAADSTKLATVERSSTEILLAITDLIVRGGALPGLFEEFTPLLRQLTNHRLVEFAICNAENSCIVTYFWGREPETRPWDGSASRAEESPNCWVFENQEALSIPDMDHETRFPEAFKELRDRGVRSYMVVPMGSPRRRYGALGIGKSEEEIAEAETLVLLKRAARLVALAVENHEIREQWQQQENRLQSLVEIGREVTSTLDLDQLLRIVFAKIREITNYDHARLALLDEDLRTLKIRSYESSESLGGRLDAPAAGGGNLGRRYRVAEHRLPGLAGDSTV